MKKSFIVVGLGYGDEGKGLVTDYLCSLYPQALVVRFSGGHQAGHTVVSSTGQRHVFSSFGSGSLRGNPSYWSRYCTFNPSALIAEYQSLIALGASPTLFIDALAMVTTPYDIAYNRAVEHINNHGSCGVGVGPTIERNSLDVPYKCFAQDMLYPVVMKHRLEIIHQYYQNKAKADGRSGLLDAYLAFVAELDLSLFFDHVEQTLQKVIIVSEQEIFSRFETVIFEGSQGILLDQEYGFFPHVTRANTTSKNAMALISQHDLGDPQVYYITRAYLTRHGNGPMANEGSCLPLINTEKETNIQNDWQGNFRRSILDIDMINYALQCDANYTANVSKHLVVTCLDQLQGPLTVTLRGKQIVPSSFLDLIRKRWIYAARFESLLQSSSDCSTDSLEEFPLEK